MQSDYLAYGRMELYSISLFIPTFFDLDGKHHEVKERCEGECIGAWAANGGKYIRCTYFDVDLCW